MAQHATVAVRVDLLGHPVPAAHVGVGRCCADPCSTGDPAAREVRNSNRRRWRTVFAGSRWAHRGVRAQAVRHAALPNLPLLDQGRRCAPPRPALFAGLYLRPGRRRRPLAPPSTTRSSLDSAVSPNIAGPHRRSRLPTPTSGVTRRPETACTPPSPSAAQCPCRRRGVKVVRPVGRSTLTPRLRHKGSAATNRTDGCGQ